MSQVAALFDHVLVDTAAGLGPAVLWFNTLAHHSLVVVTPDPTALTDTYALIKVLAQHYQRRHFLVVLNNVQSEREARQTFATCPRRRPNSWSCSWTTWGQFLPTRQ